VAGPAGSKETNTGRKKSAKALEKEQRMRFNIADFLQMLVDYLLSECARLFKVLRKNSFHQEA